MLQQFIAGNREEIVARIHRRVDDRAPRSSLDTSQQYGVSLLMAQIIEALTDARTPRLLTTAPSRISDAAAVQGHELHKSGWTVAQVVSAYGDVCQVVTELAGESAIDITPQEYQIFNHCLDEAVTGAVTAYAEQRERDLVYLGTERIGVLAHEMRNQLNTMTLAFAIMREGKVGLSGSTGAMLERSIAGLCALVDRSVAEVLAETAQPKLVQISMLQFMKEMQISGAVHAEKYGLQLTVHPVDRELTVVGDWLLLASAVSNLLQNAFKFSRARGSVSLRTRVTSERVLIDVSDECGGLAVDQTHELFRPFLRGSANQSRPGLGLSIARNAVRAHAGEIHVRNIPGTGCVFTIDLPRGPDIPASLAI